MIEKERKAARQAARKEATAADARAEAKLAKAKAAQDWQPGAGQKKK